MLSLSQTSYDAFKTEAEALARAIEWGRNAQKQGHTVEVRLTDDIRHSELMWQSS